MLCTKVNLLNLESQAPSRFSFNQYIQAEYIDLHVFGTRGEGAGDNVRLKNSLADHT